jgi:hypothetical protein
MVLRELIIMRKLSESADNLFTTKLFDVILPIWVLKNRDSSKIQEEDIKNETDFSYERNKGEPAEETKKGEYDIDYSKLDHLFIVMDLGEADLH